MATVNQQYTEKALKDLYDLKTVAQGRYQNVNAQYWPILEGLGRAINGRDAIQSGSAIDTILNTGTSVDDKLLQNLGKADTVDANLLKQLQTAITVDPTLLSRLKTVQTVDPELQQALRSNPTGEAVEAKVTTAYNTLANQDLSKRIAERRAQMNRDATARGIRGSAFRAADVNGLENYKMAEGARLGAEGVLQGINAGATARTAQQDALAKLQGFIDAASDKTTTNFKEANDLTWDAGTKTTANYLKAEDLLNAADATNQGKLEKRNTLVQDAAAKKQSNLVGVMSLLEGERDNQAGLADLIPYINAAMGVQAGTNTANAQASADKNSKWANIIGTAGAVAKIIGLLA